LAACLLHDLDADRSLPGDHVGIVERVNKRQPLFVLQFACACESIVVGVAMQNYLATQ
jgi:hypothetical protein